jgi:acetyl esterase/lipase
MSKRLFPAFAAIVIVAVVIAAAGAGADAAEQGCDAKPMKTAKDIAYVDDPVSDLQKLDVYGFAAKDCDPVPVVVYVHGGGWRRGDKSQVASKVGFFNDLGYVFVSVNYRLSDPPNDPNRPMHPDHSVDVGAAIAWVEDHIDGYGGDGANLEIIGHSAGAHLVALVGLDPKYVDDAGGKESSIHCVIPNDGSYDLTLRVDDPGGRQLLTNAFGDDPDVLRDASPMTHIGDRANLPEFLVVRRGFPNRQGYATTFADALEAAGGEVTILDANPLTHGQANKVIGAPGDRIMTPPLERFTKSCLG